jgi:hypothetical protein
VPIGRVRPAPKFAILEGGTAEDDAGHVAPFVEMETAIPTVTQCPQRGSFLTVRKSSFDRRPQPGQRKLPARGSRLVQSAPSGTSPLLAGGEYSARMRSR